MATFHRTFFSLTALFLLTAGPSPMAQDTSHPAVQEGHQHPANHLATETSPYLLQHAHNPVDWYPWGPQAIELAKSLDKPIFLSVGYAA
ncbi:MAG: hypothetical protein ACI9F9_001087, partial [Candidatus Paceibacteria bacterium]